jgi:hypothetical protein
MYKKKPLKFINFENFYGIYTAAESFYLSSRLIGEGALLRSKTDNTFTINLFAASWANDSFALELYFKCLIVKEQKTLFYEHRLNLLFNEINIEYRDKIIDYYDNRLNKKPGQPSFEEILDESAHAFSQYRYHFQEHNKKHHMVQTAIEATRKLIFEIHPSWLKLVNH